MRCVRFLPCRKVNLSHEILRLGSRLANMEHTLAAKNKETNDLKKQLSDASAREKGLLLDLAAAEVSGYFIQIQVSLYSLLSIHTGVPARSLSHIIPSFSFSFSFFNLF